MITIRKDVLSGATAQQVRDLTEGLVPARLWDLAASLAAYPDLILSVITYEDGAQELEVLYTGPPHLAEDTIDHLKFSREPGETLSLAGQSGLQRAVTLIRAVLLEASDP
jgi:ABC-type protease/lipase transport system fused ATPase/permease subunit